MTNVEAMISKGNGNKETKQMLILQPDDLNGRSNEQDSLIDIAENVGSHSKTQRSVKKIYKPSKDSLT